jgi:hypothetical protein
VGKERQESMKPSIPIFGGRGTAPQCQAKAKHSGEQCRKPAMRGKAVCRTHGGASTGSKTQQGRERCAQAKTVHGWETREIRHKRADKLRELRQIERDMKAIGLIDTP